MPDRHDFVQRANAAYIEEQYERYRRDPASVPEDWALFFAGFELAQDPARRPGRAARAGGAFGLVHAYRELGHLIARLNPLGGDAEAHPLLELSAFGLKESDLGVPTDGAPFHGESGATLGDLLAALRETYCGPIGVEYMHISDPERREWLERMMESSHNRPALSAEARQAILRRMLAADAFEQFLHVKYVGQKRFSLEGAASLIPLLDTLIDVAAEAGVEQLVLGMPHRGRLNVLAHILGKPLEAIFGEFESHFAPEDVSGHGDVKYHMGYSNARTARNGRTVHLDLNFNPSHLEMVNPVVLGSMRARQVVMSDTAGDRGVPVLLHGDAAFSGEGIVPEMLGMAPLPAYQTGGTVHVVVNNQIGFTTAPWHARSTRYCTDIARVIDAPVFHVNGDDPEAVVHLAALVMAYRMQFKRDVLIDVVCYRKHGHNEMDDPTFTQPAMYQKIAAHPPAARAYAERLIADGALDPPGLEAMEREVAAVLQSAHQRLRAESASDGPAALGGAWKGLEWAGDDWSADTRTPRERLLLVAERLAATPEGFTPHPKIARLHADRTEMIRKDRIDWGLGESLAYGSLLLEGRNVRLSGQDTGRGTFSHRHAVLRDHHQGTRWIPLQHLAEDQGRFEVIDTPLNESACLGFEYGYTTADPHTLVLWEAQFGDFVNVAQVYVDQFLASAESKWRRMSGLVLLLPHGYEGQGPEHSSARLERFLELCANGNMQVCNPTTPAQLYHVLRRQLHRRFRKPLVLMTPKSLLRHKRVVSTLDELAAGSFQMVIDDAVADPGAVRRVLLTSGKFYYTLLEAREARGVTDAALIRVEQYYPFPRVELAAILARYPHARDIRWVQEEPANMGAWRALRHRFEGLLPEGATLGLVSRKASPTPATGYYAKHVEQEQAVLDRALAEVGGSTLAARRASGPHERAGARRGG